MRNKIIEILETASCDCQGILNIEGIADEIMGLFTFVRIGDDERAYMYSQKWLDEMRRNQGNLPLDEGHG